MFSDGRRFQRAFAARQARRLAVAQAEQFTAEWFPEQRAFYEDPAQLVAAICGRRAGKTRGGCRHFVKLARTIRGARLLYLNETRGEAERLAWFGTQNDGMASLVTRYGINAKLDASDLSIYFPDTDAWIWLRGAKDEREVRKALGGAYHEVWWDEAQKIPPKLESTIREVFMPALLDFGGRFRTTGTPVRQMAGLFHDATRSDGKRNAQWSLHHWTLLNNPHFGATAEERWSRGIVGLQRLYGGEDVVTIESPIMQREAFGRWVREDAAFVYAVHRVPHDRLLYAPHRARADGFVDVPRALADLPWRWQDAQFALGCDIGWYPDPFALCLWAWHPHDPRLYEVCSWKRNYMTADEQNAALNAIRQHVAVGMVVADGGSPSKPTVQGWAREWIERYNQPFVEAEKSNKHGSIDTYNNDIVRGLVQFRDGGPLFEEMSQLQWSGVVSGSGRLVEDPTMANDVCDASLYAHRHSYQFRWRPEEKKPDAGTVEYALREEREIEEDRLDDEAIYH